MDTGAMGWSMMSIASSPWGCRGGSMIELHGESPADGIVRPGSAPAFAVVITGDGPGLRPTMLSVPRGEWSGFFMDDTLINTAHEVKRKNTMLRDFFVNLELRL